MNNSNRLEEFVKRFVEQSGGIHETDRSGKIYILIPPETAKELDIDQEAVVGGDEIPLLYGSPMLDRMIAKLKSDIPVLYAGISPGYLKKAGFERILERDISFPDSRAHIRDTAESRRTYMILVADYTAISDERKEGHVRVAVAESSGAVIQGMENDWDTMHHVEYFKPGQIPLSFPRDIKAAFMKAMAAAREKAESELSNFFESMQRRLQRDISNIHEYYKALEQEMIEGLKNPRLGETQREERKAKIAELPAEAARKIDDLRQKYQIVLRLRPAAAVRLLVDCVSIITEIRYGKLRQDLSLSWNPLTKRIDPVVCGNCGATTREILCSPRQNQLSFICFDCRNKMKSNRP